MQIDLDMVVSDPTSTPDKDDMHLSFQSGLLCVRRALGAFMDTLEPIALDETEAGTVELVLAEALNNVVEHAYGDRTQGLVDLRWRHGPSGLLIAIRDHGKAVPEDNAMMVERAFGPEARVDLPEGGYGWFIIRSLAHDIEYQRVDGQNTLTFRIAVGVQMTAT